VYNKIIATFACSPQLSSFFLFSSEASLLGDEENEREDSKLSPLRQNSITRFLSGKEKRSSEMPSLQQLSNYKRLETVYASRYNSALFLQRLRDSIFKAINQITKSFFFFKIGFQEQFLTQLWRKDFEDLQ
jgi:hypothetical protein